MKPTMASRLGSVCLLSLLTAICSMAASNSVQFNRDIRPIMSDTCFRCHGPDKNSRMAGMRLDIRDEALKPTKSGVTPIVPGDPDKSAIIQRIFATEREVMPPAFAHKELTAGTEGDHPAMGGRGRDVRRPLGVSAGARPAVPSRPAPRIHRCLHPGPACGARD